MTVVDLIDQAGEGLVADRHLLLLLKLRFNYRWPHLRLCLHPWCWRFQTYDYRCHRHQGS